MKVNIDNRVLLELLIQNLAHQRATSRMLIELLSKDENHASDLNEAMNFFLKEETNVLLNDVYTHYGIIDLKNLFGE